MTHIEIRKAIDMNNDIINSLLTPNQFILNNTIAQLLKENRELQAQCQHNFINGYCEYCDMEEKD